MKGLFFYADFLRANIKRTFYALKFTTKHLVRICVSEKKKHRKISICFEHVRKKN